MSLPSRETPDRCHQNTRRVRHGNLPRWLHMPLRKSILAEGLARLLLLYDRAGLFAFSAA